MTVDGQDVCLNGPSAADPNNCNIYTDKSYVWLNGGPATAYVGDGQYFFAVLQPGGQPDPNDGSAKNLSDRTEAPWSAGDTNADGTAVGSGDLVANRTFTVTDGTVSYSGTHTFADNKIRLMPYDDSPNNGGVYVLAICSLDQAYPVAPSRCKYDAFKVRRPDAPQTPVENPSVVKDAQGAYDSTWSWTIGKRVDTPFVRQDSGSVTLNYTVEVQHGNAVDSNVTAGGVITVTNGNVDAQGATVPVTLSSVTDQLSDETTCVVDTSAGLTLSTFATRYPYTCSPSALPSGPVTNRVTIAWPGQTLSDGRELAGGGDSFDSPPIVFDPNRVDDCVTVTDVFNGGAPGTLGRSCVGDPNPGLFTYPRTVPVVPNQCVTRNNTAGFVTDDTRAQASAQAGATVCGPAAGLTMGFWQNKNGQSLISTAGTGAGGPYSAPGSCRLTEHLRQYPPFQDLRATAGCGAVVTSTKSTSIDTSSVTGYAYSVIKAANASGATMHAMLKAQMLATALDVYFSDVSTAGHAYGLRPALGNAQIDLTQVCKMLPSTAGSSTCSGTYVNAGSAFGGATSMTVNGMLTHAGSKLASGSWYGGVKSEQEKAKDAFDNINNTVARLAP